MPDRPTLIRIRSEVLGEDIWLAADSLRLPPGDASAPHLHEGLVVYRAREMRILRQMKPDALRLMHEVKRVFGGSVEDAASKVAISYSNNYPYRKNESEVTHA